MGYWNRKAKLFRKWLPQDKNASLVLALLAERMSNRELIDVLKNFEARGYSLDKRGIPIGFEEGNAEVILALHEAFEEVLGEPVVNLLYARIEEEMYYEQWKQTLDKFRRWLIDVSRSAEKPKWWQKINWRQISYEALSLIADLLDEDGYPINEEGVPTPLNEEDAEGLWDVLKEDILCALTRFVLEVRDEEE